MRTRAALTGAGWLAGAVVAVVGVTAAMSVLGHDLLGSGDPMLTAAQVQQKLAQSGQAAVRVAGPATPRAAANGAAAKRFESGIVSATCAGGRATLSSWSVAQGFRVASVQAGPATAASIHLASSSTDVAVTVTCGGSTPQFVCITTPATTAAAGPAASASAPAEPADPDGGERKGGPGGGGGHGGNG